MSLCKLIISAALLVTPMYLLAQQQVSENSAYKRSQEMMEKAAQAGVEMGRRQTLASDRDGLNYEQLRKTQGADPLAIANRFKYQGNAVKNSGPELMIFVSTSMPKRALEMLGLQAKQTGATILLRGMVGKLGTKGVLEATTKALEPVANSGAAIQIDPEAFARYHVTAVPTFVIATREEDCGTDQCKSDAFSLTGDVSLEFVLEKWADQPGELGRIATGLLKKLDHSDK